jgi:hypothetical protein
LAIEFGQPGIKERDPGDAVNSFELIKNRVPLLT